MPGVYLVIWNIIKTKQVTCSLTTFDEIRWCDRILFDAENKACRLSTNSKHHLDQKSEPTEDWTMFHGERIPHFKWHQISSNFLSSFFSTTTFIFWQPEYICIWCLFSKNFKEIFDNIHYFGKGSFLVVTNP